MGLLTWLHDRIWPYELTLSESDSEISAALCAVEQIRSGTTSIAEMAAAAEATALTGAETTGAETAWPAPGATPGPLAVILVRPLGPMLCVVHDTSFR